MLSFARRLLALLALLALSEGCSPRRFATPYVVLTDGHAVAPVVVGLSMEGEVYFRRSSCSGVDQSPILHLDPAQRPRLRRAAELLRKLPGEEPEDYRRDCPNGERPLRIGIYESSNVHRWWSACIPSVDAASERLPLPFQEVLRVIKEIPETSYHPQFVLH